MSAAISILYPRSPSAPFDMKYYLSEHMPLCGRKWGPYGMVKWEVYEMDETSSYSVQAITHWESVEQYQKAMQEASVEIMADVDAFSDVKPIIIMGKPVGAWKREMQTISQDVLID